MNKIKKACGKCGGTGFLSQYRAISGGTCFPCYGKGYYMTTEKTIKEKERREKKKDEKAKTIREWNEGKYETFLSEFENDKDFNKRMKGMNPREEGYQLGFNIMQCFEAWGRFNYDVPESV